MNNQGFAILYAVVISALIIVLGTGLFSFAVRENELSNTLEDSIETFYIADAGIECMLEYEMYVDEIEPGQNHQITCPFDQIELADSWSNGNTVNSDNFNDGQDPNLPGCGQVIVRVNQDVDDDGNADEKDFTVRGYSNCDGDNNIVQDDRLLIERRMRAWFDQ